MTDFMPVGSACRGPSRASLARFSVGEMGAADQADVSRHVQTCEGCQRELADLAADRSAVALSVPWTRIEARLAAASTSRRARRLRTMILAPLGICAALTLWLADDRAPSLPEVRSKGAVGLSFAVREETGAREGIDGEALRAGDAIRIRYSAGGAPYLLVVGVDADGRVFPYFEENGQSRRAADTAGLLPDSVVLDADPRPERVYLFASQAPLDLAGIEAVARRSLDQGLTIESMDRLPVNADQASILLRKRR